MTRVNKIKLISFTETQDEIGQITSTESEASLIAEIRSVSRSEFMEGRQDGLTPSYVFYVSRFAYSGQRVIEYNGERYSVYRTFEADDNIVELYTEREVGLNVERSDSGGEQP